MGIFGFGRVPTTQVAQALAPGRQVRLASPWSQGLTTSIMAADWFGATNLPVMREQAMRVPAVSAARNLICEGVAQGVLETWNLTSRLARQPAWLTRTDGDLPPARRLAWTVDDLLFSAFSLWGVARGAGGAILDAWRVPAESWDFDEDGSVLVDQRPAAADEVILFTGRDDGLLLNGNETIRRALDLSATVSARARNPVPTTLLKETYEQGRTDGTDPMDLDDEGNPRNEVKDVVDSFLAARRDRDRGSITYVPYGIDVEAYGQDEVSFYENARNFDTLEVARLTGVPAGMLDASGVAASLTYETTQSNRSILADRIREWASLIECRLSMDDCTPRGTRVVLNLSNTTGPNTGLPAESED